MEKQKTSTLQDEDKFMLRLPEGMRNKLKLIAEESGRSLNSELVHRLVASISVPQDIVVACDEVKPKDRVDFAVKVLQRAGFQVTLPSKKAK